MSTKSLFTIVCLCFLVPTAVFAQGDPFGDPFAGDPFAGSDSDPFGGGGAVAAEVKFRAARGKFYGVPARLA